MGEDTREWRGKIERVIGERLHEANTRRIRLFAFT